MRRYTAWHKTEPGYDTKDEVEMFIARQSNPIEWRIVVTTDEYEPTPEADAERAYARAAEINQAVTLAIAQERQRIRTLMGL